VGAPRKQRCDDYYYYDDDVIQKAPIPFSWVPLTPRFFVVVSLALEQNAATTLLAFVALDMGSALALWRIIIVSHVQVWRRASSFFLSKTKGAQAINMAAVVFPEIFCFKTWGSRKVARRL
jgi:hypothetical protein